MGNCGCVRSVLGIGYTEYHNICTGEFASLMWGAGDWVVLGLVALLSTTLVVAAAALVALARP